MNRAMAHPHPNYDEPCELHGERWQDRLPEVPRLAAPSHWPDWLVILFLVAFLLLLWAVIYTGIALARP
jgi:hypothetical protein